MKTSAQEILESEEIKKMYGIAAIELNQAIDATGNTAMDVIKQCREKLFGNIGRVVTYQDLVDINMALINLTYARSCMKRVFEKVLS